jgi:hypothetical protein
MADLELIAGGVGAIDVDTMVHGGQEMVVGGSAKCESRDKILHLKHVPNDTKKLLAILNMSRPVVFGNIQYDDGSKKKLRSGPRTDAPNEALIDMLQERLNRKPYSVVENLVHEYKLAEPVYWVLTDLIQTLLKQIGKRPNVKAIKINGDIGEILDRVRKGDAYFKVATDHKEWPKNMTSVVRELLNILTRKRTPNGVWNMPVLSSSKWPRMCSKNEAAMNEVSAKKYKTTRQYVEAIVLREHILMKHMDAVEQYYVKSAHNIKKYESALIFFFGKNTCPATLKAVQYSTQPSR